MKLEKFNENNQFYTDPILLKKEKQKLIESIIILLDNNENNYDILNKMSINKLKEIKETLIISNKPESIEYKKALETLNILKEKYMKEPSVIDIKLEKEDNEYVMVFEVKCFTEIVSESKFNDYKLKFNKICNIEEMQQIDENLEVDEDILQLQRKMMFNENSKQYDKYGRFINENYERKANNKIQLLIEYKMMESNWKAWTEDSYTSTLFQLDDSEINDFMNKYDSEIEEIQYEVNIFYDKYVR